MEKRSTGFGFTSADFAASLHSFAPPPPRPRSAFRNSNRLLTTGSSRLSMPLPAAPTGTVVPPWHRNSAVRVSGGAELFVNARFVDRFVGVATRPASAVVAGRSASVAPAPPSASALRSPSSLSSSSAADRGGEQPCALPTVVIAAEEPVASAAPPPPPSASAPLASPLPPPHTPDSTRARVSALYDLACAAPPSPLVGEGGESTAAVNGGDDDDDDDDDVDVRE
ncbi:hypothetical protein HDU87_006911 [Geranomyces variabilis]|uniref:Uncharacterized protein n=1 Tax=Geranomyces variabilis TaxID=109894 RepID=A0AAD5TFA2_9FUNG|nr:hypothetical protein HDU87_006911 [Geranomyces variabilis]